MTLNLEIPIFTADVEEHDHRSAERSGCRNLLSLCREIHSGGGQRVRFELNAANSYKDGGLTPNVERTIKFLTHFRKSPWLTEAQQPAIRIMIRPRGWMRDPKSTYQMQELEDFQYSDAELKQMHDAIASFKTYGAHLLSPERGDGFVFGALERFPGRLHGLVLDAKANSHLIQVAHPYPCVLHRAFDCVLSTRNDPDIYGPPWSEIPPSSVEELVAGVKELGFKGVLTSGGWGYATAPDNLKTLAELGRAALKGDGFQLIVGGAVRDQNLWRICAAMRELALHPDLWLHSSCFSHIGGFDEILVRDILRAMRSVETAVDLGYGMNELVL